MAAGGATVALFGGGGEGERRVGVGQITAHGNPSSSFSLYFFPLCVRQGFDEKFSFQQCRTNFNSHERKDDIYLQPRFSKNAILSCLTCLEYQKLLVFIEFLYYILLIPFPAI